MEVAIIATLVMFILSLALGMYKSYRGWNSIEKFSKNLFMFLVLFFMGIIFIGLVYTGEVIPEARPVLKFFGFSFTFLSMFAGSECVAEKLEK